MVKRALILLCLAAAAAVASVLVGYPATASTTVGSSVVGSSGVYDYSPSVAQYGSGTAQVQQDWWCAGLHSDTIVYEEIGLNPLRVLVPETSVLTEGGPGSWDSAYVCNPHVIRGLFVNPIGDGFTYTYEMFYVGTSEASGTDNSIGVAFSDDGVAWVKAPAPVIPSDSSGGVFYGVGQPDAWNAAGAAGSQITLVYEDRGTGDANTSHVEAVSTDGVHFTTVGTLSTAGLTYPHATLGDLAYDQAAGLWYGLYDQPLRPSATTGGFVERGQPGVALYRTANLLTGSWTQLDTLDTTQTGYEANFIGTLLRDPFGDLVWNSGAVEMYVSTSTDHPAANASPLQMGQSGDTPYWDIAWSTWTPGQPMRTLSRYYSGPSNTPSLNRHMVTTGWHDASAYTLETTKVLGSLFEAPTNAATLALYGCKQGSVDQFVSADPACGGSLVLGLLGYAYPTPPAGVNTLPLYECSTAGGDDHFVSTDPACEGTTTVALLGYSQAPP